MKNDKIIPGAILVVIGAGFLLANYGYLHFHWWNFIHLWPIVLVIAGVNLVFANNRSPLAVTVKIGVLAVGLGLLLFGNFDRYSWWPKGHYSFHDDNFNIDDDDDDNDDNSDSTKATYNMHGNGAFNMPYDAAIHVARLNVSGGGTSYNLSDTTNQLFSASTLDNDNRYNFWTNKEDSVMVVNFKMKDHKGIDFDSDKNQATMRLNPNPIWDVLVETGASKIDFDLSKFKVRNLTIHGGAAAYEIKMGQPLSESSIDIQTGVSSVDISIPENAACRIESNSGLSNTHYDGFNKTNDNNYETPNYATAKNKLHIHISGGLSDFKVNKY